MIVPDVNLLLYAYDSRSSHHEAAAVWWQDCVNGAEPSAYPTWSCSGSCTWRRAAAFLFAPLTLQEAAGYVEEWLAEPHVFVAEGGPDHVNNVLELLRDAGTQGALATDAQIAAVALHHRATVFSNDSDFGRFRDLRWKNPLA